MSDIDYLKETAVALGIFDDPSDDEYILIASFVDEIKRLRERVKNLGIDIERKIVTITRQRECIKELEEKYQDQGDALDECLGIKEYYEKCIEELESEAGGAAWCLEWLVADKYRKPDAPGIVKKAQKHYREMLNRIEELEKKLDEEYQFLGECDVVVTTEQIDAAWDMISCWLDSKQGAIEVLAKLGIVRCEECGGSGKREQYYPPVVEEDCPDCNGHGWVKND